MEKSKSRLDVSSEELERVLLQKEGESFSESAVQAKPGMLGGGRVLVKAVTKSGLLLRGKNPGNVNIRSHTLLNEWLIGDKILRQEDDVRSRVSNASDVYRKALHDIQAMRQEYFKLQLPRILRVRVFLTLPVPLMLIFLVQSLKECVDEIDLGTQYHLTRYAFLFESMVLTDGSVLVPLSTDEGKHVVSDVTPAMCCEVHYKGNGLKALFESIDGRADFKTYMQNYAYARGGTPRGPRREGPVEEGFVSSICQLLPVFW